MAGSTGASRGLARRMLVAAGCVTAALFAFAGAARAAGNVYVPDGTGAVYQYGIGASGALAPLAPASIPAGLHPELMSVGFGNFVYSTDLKGSQVLQFKVGSGGGLTALSPAAVPSGASPYDIVADPSGAHQYVTSYADNAVWQYSETSTGQLTELAPPLTVPFPTGEAVSPDGRYLYVTGCDPTYTYGMVYEFRIDASGALQAITPAAVPTGASCANRQFVIVTPDSGDVYVTNVADDVISQFGVALTGALIPLSPATVPTGENPLLPAVSQRGLVTSVYVPNDGDATISQYTVSLTGTLIPDVPATVSTSTDPFAYPFRIAIDPVTGSAYVDNDGAMDVAQFSIRENGTLLPMTPATVPAGPYPLGLVVRP